MLWEHPETIFLRLCFSGPLLYIGLSMAIDPLSFVKSVQMLACALRTFEHRLHGFQWREQSLQPDSGQISPRTGIAVRCAGVAVAVCALLYFVAA